MPLGPETMSAVNTILSLYKVTNMSGKKPGLCFVCVHLEKARPTFHLGSASLVSL